METLFKAIDRVTESLVAKTATESLIFLMIAVYFAFLYFNEKRRNSALTNLLIAHTEKHSSKFVDVVTSGIEADHKLSHTINKLTNSMAEIKSALDRVVASTPVSPPTHIPVNPAVTEPSGKD